MARSRNYCFTSYLSHDEFFSRVFADRVAILPHNSIKYICWGEEICPETDREHLQGYVQFADSVTISTVKRRLDNGSLHLEPRRGTAAQAVAYCEKEGNFHEYGRRPAQGTRTDIERIRSMVSGGEGMRAIIEVGANYQCLRYAEKVLTYCEAKREVDPIVIWYWGPTGTGKTHAAVTEATKRYGADSIWWSNGGVKWFDGYDAHEVAMFDDFRPEWCKLSWLLRALDRYPMRVPFKGGYRAWRPKRIYITCPKPPGECYLDSGEDNAQLLRRIDYTKEFTKVHRLNKRTYVVEEDE